MALTYFLFPPFNPPGADHALVAMDMLIDRYMRELPKAARGRDVTIYTLGSTTGLGGKETEESLEAKKRNGFDVHGAYYAEYIMSVLPTDPEELANTDIILQGVSRGTITAAATKAYLPVELQDIKGKDKDGNEKVIHRPVRILADANLDSGMRVATGFGKEILWQSRHNPFMKALANASDGFPEYLIQKAGIEKDSLRDNLRKIRGSARDAINLVKGKTPMPTDTERIYMRQGLQDPLRNSSDLEGRTVKTIGRSIMAPAKGRHFFDLYQRMPRIEKNLKDCAAVVARKAA